MHRPRARCCIISCRHPLAPADRLVLTLMYFEDCSIKEIAQPRGMEFGNGENASVSRPQSAQGNHRRDEDDRCFEGNCPWNPLMRSKDWLVRRARK